MTTAVESAKLAEEFQQLFPNGTIPDSVIQLFWDRTNNDMTIGEFRDKVRTMMMPPPDLEKVVKPTGEMHEFATEQALKAAKSPYYKGMRFDKDSFYTQNLIAYSIAYWEHLHRKT